LRRGTAPTAGQLERVRTELEARGVGFVSCAPRADNAPTRAEQEQAEELDRAVSSYDRMVEGRPERPPPLPRLETRSASRRAVYRDIKHGVLEDVSATTSPITGHAGPAPYRDYGPRTEKRPFATSFPRAS
jgi:hypothetical protein